MSDNPLQGDTTDTPTVSQTVDGIIDFDAYAIAAIGRGERACAIAALELATAIDEAIEQRAADHYAGEAVQARMRALKPEDRNRVASAVSATIRSITDVPGCQKCGDPGHHEDNHAEVLKSVLTAPACGMPFSRSGYAIKRACSRPRGHAGAHRS